MRNAAVIESGAGTARAAEARNKKPIQRIRVRMSPKIAATDGNVKASSG
jgi:hypothetical protein